MLRTTQVFNELIEGAIMEAYTYALKEGIRRTAEFERKGLASFGVTCGIKCGNGCLYCYMSGLL